MKKVKKTLAVFVLACQTLSLTAGAATIDSFEYASGNITVKGTSGESVVTYKVYDKDTSGGSIETICEMGEAIVNDGEFVIEIKMPNTVRGEEADGEYVVKVMGATADSHDFYVIANSSLVDFIDSLNGNSITTASDLVRLFGESQDSGYTNMEIMKNLGADVDYYAGLEPVEKTMLAEAFFSEKGQSQVSIENFSTLFSNAKKVQDINKNMASAEWFDENGFAFEGVKFSEITDEALKTSILQNVNGVITETSKYNTCAEIENKYREVNVIYALNKAKYTEYEEMIASYDDILKMIEENYYQDYLNMQASNKNKVDAEVKNAIAKKPFSSAEEFKDIYKVAVEKVKKQIPNSSSSSGGGGGVVIIAAPEEPVKSGEGSGTRFLFPLESYIDQNITTASTFTVEGAENVEYIFTFDGVGSPDAKVRTLDASDGTRSMRIRGTDTTSKDIGLGALFTLKFGKPTEDGQYVISFDLYRELSSIRDYAALNHDGWDGAARLTGNTKWTVTELGTGNGIGGTGTGRWSRYTATLSTDANDPQLNFAVANGGELHIDNIIVKDTSGNTIFAESFEADGPTIGPETSNPAEVPAGFSDLANVDWAKDAIEKLAKNGIVAGYDDNTFKPHKNITREEFIKMVVAAQGISLNANACALADVDQSKWYAPYVNAAYQAGIIKGVSETEFGIGKEITREDMAVIIARIKNYGSAGETQNAFVDEEGIAPYAKDAVYSLHKAGKIAGIGDNMFGPKQIVTRAQAAKIIADTLYAGI